ncbi:MAG: hypothetical protein ACRDDA_09730 [Aeromonas sp.]
MSAEKAHVQKTLCADEPIIIELSGILNVETLEQILANTDEIHLQINLALQVSNKLTLSRLKYVLSKGFNNIVNRFRTSDLVEPNVGSIFTTMTEEDLRQATAENDIIEIKTFFINVPIATGDVDDDTNNPARCEDLEGKGLSNVVEEFEETEVWYDAVERQTRDVANCSQTDSPDVSLQTEKELDVNLKTPEENLKTPKGILKTPEENLKTPKGILKTPEENLKTLGMKRVSFKERERKGVKGFFQRLWKALKSCNSHSKRISKRNSKR